MPPTGSIFSNKSVQRAKNFFKPKGKKNDSSPFFTSKTETIGPAPVKDGPSTREVKPEDAKQEVRATNEQKVEHTTKKDEQDLEDTKKALDTVTDGNTPERKDTLADKGKSTARTENQAETFTKISTRGPYAALVAFENSSAPKDIVYTRYSSYTPNCISMFANLRTAEMMLKSNIKIEWTQKKYLSVPVRLYVAVMYYVTILNCKEVLRQNETSVSTWLRKFNREYPPATLPIPGYLLPQFASLAAYQVPDDDRQSWIFPTLPDNIGNRMISGAEIDEQFRFTQPNPSQLFDIMKAISSTSTAANVFYEEHGRTTFMPATPNRYFGGHQFTTGYRRQDATNLANPSLWHPFPESKVAFTGARDYWQQSQFASAIPAAHTGGAADYSTIPRFLRLEGSMAWFAECVSMMRIHCSFFDHTTNFKQLDYDAGPEIGIYTDVSMYYNEYEETAYTGASLPDLSTVTWYPQMTTSAYASIFIYEDGVSLLSYLTAKHCLTNSRITFRFRVMNSSSAVVDTDVIALSHATITSTTEPNYYPRDGPWFGQIEGTALPRGKTTTLWRYDDGYHVEVLSGREDYIRNNFYLPNPVL